MSTTTADRVAELERQLERERQQHREQLTAVAWARWKDRFHAFDGIKNDQCPACGGRVRVVEIERSQPGDPEGMRLEAVGRLERI